MFYDVWAWIPLVWSFSGCLTGALVYWLFIEVPKHLETKKKLEKENDNGEFKQSSDINDNDIEIERLSMILNEKLVNEQPPKTPKIPNFNRSPPQQLKTFLADEHVSPTTIKKFCKKNQISAPELEHYLARYRAVPADYLDLGNGVTVKVTDADKEEEYNK